MPFERVRLSRTNRGGTTEKPSSLWDEGFILSISNLHLEGYTVEQQLLELRTAAEMELTTVRSTAGLSELRVKYLGKKGLLTGILRLMGGLSAEERPRFGQLANELRNHLENSFDEQQRQLEAGEQQERFYRERVDITLPGFPFALGSKHPVTQTMDRIKEIFLGMGFSIADGPEVESDHYNFQMLNIPLDHPARDMQDTFYFTPDILLRTHTSPMQARTMEKTAPHLPVKIIVPGKVYRKDDDATHSPMFHQVEGLYVDHKVSLSDLKGVLLSFARQMYGPDRQIRLRPSFFPFTEPSVEIDISCFACGGTGCRLCKSTGWLEILGGGMVHPNVLRMSGYDPEQVTGFAFGMGIERVAMLKLAIDDMRLLYQNDLRFLAQF